MDALAPMLFMYWLLGLAPFQGYDFHNCEYGEEYITGVYEIVCGPPHEHPEDNPEPLEPAESKRPRSIRQR